MNLKNKLNSKVSMVISEKLLKYFNRKASKSFEKNHTRFRNDICNHWDLDYLSIKELERIISNEDENQIINTTIPKKKKDI